jgi:hypothetical protein
VHQHLPLFGPAQREAGKEGLNLVGNRGVHSSTISDARH